MLNIALPKGRLGDQVYELLASVGYDCKSIYDENRKLVFENPQTGVRYPVSYTHLTLPTIA